MIHLVGLPHTETTDRYLSCAYTQKAVKFCRMMVPIGHEVTLYAGEHNDAPCTEHVPILTGEERDRLYGAADLGVMPFWPDDWTLFNARAIDEIRARAEPKDLVLLAGGRSQALVCDSLSDLLVVEPFVGYEGVYAAQVAFESYAWQHHVYAKLGTGGRFFDAVIPNFFDPDDFADSEPWRVSMEPFLLYLGRVVADKGVRTAADIAVAAGMQLVVAGPGEMDLPGDVVRVGPVGLSERSRLLHQAAAVLVPTTYVEPFGGVAVEAMICGTPALTTDWGAFTENVPDEYRFRTLRQALDCLEVAMEEDPEELREWALDRWSLDAVAADFEEWFDSLSTLWQDGWYSLRNREVLT